MCSAGRWPTVIPTVQRRHHYAASAGGTEAERRSLRRRKRSCRRRRRNGAAAGKSGVKQMDYLTLIAQQKQDKLALIEDEEEYTYGKTGAGGAQAAQ